MAEYNCPNCRFRAKYDKNPKSFLSRLWRWHTSFCPGWNGYMKSLSKEERLIIAEKYDLKKFL